MPIDGRMAEQCGASRLGASRPATPLSLDRKETLAPATAWMSPEDIVLSETSQTEKDRWCVTPLIHEAPSVVQFTETGSRWQVPWAGGQAECFMGTESSLGR